MTAEHFTSLWPTIGSGMGDHLWQSTLFALTAWLLAVALRNNPARTRYWVWLVASIKFLVPFSLLVALGSYLGAARVSDGIETGPYLVVDEFCQPFTQPRLSIVSPIIPVTSNATTMFSRVAHALPYALALVWSCGFLAVLIAWYRRSRRICSIVREGVPLVRGREVDALRRLERIQVGTTHEPIEIRLVRGSLELGIFGVLRPVLLWPEGVSRQLDDAHLEGILVHEVEHVRRRDNLTAAMHMMVQAIFWFLPVVWWLGRRLTTEREGACDEEVLNFGEDRRVYAEGILKVCEFCISPSLTCMSGIFAGSLGERIGRVMTERGVRRLGPGGKLLLLGALSVAMTAPVVFGLAQGPRNRTEYQAQQQAAFGPEFKYEVALIKPNKSTTVRFRDRNLPNGFIRSGVTVMDLFQQAYRSGPPLRRDQILGPPSWFYSERYFIDAKMDDSIADEVQKLAPDQRQLALQIMLQRLLADRFKLNVHREARQFPIYTLVVSKGGPKLKAAKADETYTFKINGETRSRGNVVFAVQPGVAEFHLVPISRLTIYLERHLDRNVVDKTGLTGSYDFTLRYAPTQAEIEEMEGPDSTGKSQEAVQKGMPALTPSAPTGLPPLSKALEEQLGLKLEPGKGPVEVFVVDHIERPSAN